MATPVVELALTDPVNDQNFLRNGNFYSSFWTTPAGVSCPSNVWTTNASYWLCRPQGAAASFQRTTIVPDMYSLFSAAVVGNTGITSTEFGQQINGDLSATLRRNVTFSGYYFNNSGLNISPALHIYSADAFNNFSAVTLQTTVNLQTGPTGAWTFMSATVDLSLLTNIANGILVAVQTTGVLTTSAKSIYFSRLKLQIGEVATEFVDDPSLFIQTPSVDSTMLQDGCIARPSLFLPNVIPTGAYMAKSINNGDINDGAIDSRTLVPSANTTLSSGFTQPAVSSTVAITVGSTVGFVAPQPISITGGGWYTVSSVTDATHMVVINAGISGNAAPAAAVPTGGVVFQASAALNNLGYVPINKAGDTGIGSLQFDSDDVLGAASYSGAGVVLKGSSANANNTGYLPAIGFHRPGVVGRAIGLATTGRFTVVDNANNQGYLLDSWFKVATADIQDGAITAAKLATSLVNMFMAPGTITMFAGPNPPSGWFVCDGSPVSRTTYAALFAAIGTYWGVGDNSSTFNVPDLRGRAPIGYVNIAASGITARGFATRGGAETHQLSIAEMPAHDHSFSQSGHAHTLTNTGSHTHGIPNPYGSTLGVTGGGGTSYIANGVIQSTASTISGGTDAANAAINFSAQGGNTPATIMQPFSVLYYLIKY